MCDDCEYGSMLTSWPDRRIGLIVGRGAVWCVEMADVDVLQDRGEDPPTAKISKGVLVEILKGGG